MQQAVCPLGVWQNKKTHNALFDFKTLEDMSINKSE